MGGAIAQLVARDHPDVVSGLVLSGTAQHWQDPEPRVLARDGRVRADALAGAARTWRAGFRRAGIRRVRADGVAQSELMRHTARDIAEAGRELGRFDSRPWLRSLAVPSRSSSRRATAGPAAQAARARRGRWARRCSRPRSTTSRSRPGRGATTRALLAGDRRGRRPPRGRAAAAQAVTARSIRYACGGMRRTRIIDRADRVRRSRC